MKLINWWKKHFETKFSGNVGPISIELKSKNIPVEALDTIGSPLAACENEPISPPLIIKATDIDGYPINEKNVRLEFYDKNGLMSTQQILGKLSKTTDKDGIAYFEDICVKITGVIVILILVDEIEVITESIQILPPGLSVDFWNEKVGSPEYEKKFDRAIQFSATE